MEELEQIGVDFRRDWMLMLSVASLEVFGNSNLFLTDCVFDLSDLY